MGQKGLTLVEIMIVLVILGLVMGFVGSKIIGAGDNAKRDLTNLKIQQLKSDIEQFQLRYNAIPRSLEDLTKCTDLTGQGCLPIVNDPDSINDAWGTPLEYTSNGRTYKVSSLGADRKAGGEGPNYDLAVEGP